MRSIRDDESDGGEDSSKEKEATQANGAQQASMLSCVRLCVEEYAKFLKFSDSLLTRSSKLADLISNLETALEESGKSKDGSEAGRVKKP